MKEYLVCLQTDGIVDTPAQRLSNCQIIKAIDEKQAEEKYNKLNNCYYFYGSCVGEVENDKIIIRVSSFIEIINAALD